MYIPDLKIGIEYDGDYYHNNDAAIIREKRKEQILKENEIFLIRVKETNKNLFFINISPLILP